MLTVEEALSRLLSGARPISGVEEVDTFEASGRVLARGLTASIAVPPLANSQMDGYAVRSIDVPAAGTRLRVIISSPGRDRGTWKFATTGEAGDERQVGRGGEHASSLVLSLVEGIDVTGDDRRPHRRRKELQGGFLVPDGVHHRGERFGLAMPARSVGLSSGALVVGRRQAGDSRRHRADEAPVEVAAAMRMDIRAESGAEDGQGDEGEIDRYLRTEEPKG